MSVYKRGAKGIFYMNFTINGIRIFKSTGKFTKKEAKHVEAMERQKIMNEASMSPQEKAAKMLLSDAVDHIYNTRWKHNKDAKGTHRKALRLLELIGDIPLSKIEEQNIVQLVIKLEKRDIENSTINRYLTTLKTILKFHKQQIGIIKLTKERSGRIRVVSETEESTVVKLLRDTKHSKRRHFYYEVADLVEVLVDTGMRLSEVLNLQYEDINYDSNLISIWINKGDRPRSIPMTKRVKAILQRRQHGNIIKPFTVTKYQADKAWGWVRKEVGLEGDREFVLHALRHTTASRLVNRGIDLYTVKEWLGHADITTTQKYAHLSPNKLAHAASVLEL